MDICVVTNDARVARFIELELIEAGYNTTSSEVPTDAKLYICDLDSGCDVLNGAIGFSRSEGKRNLVENFLLRPIDALKLRSTVSKLLAEPFSVNSTVLEVTSTTRKAKTEKGEVRLSEKELSLLRMLCTSPLVTRSDGAKLFGDGDSNVVDVYVHYLRKKLSAVCDGKTVISKRGAGYTLSDTLNIKFI